MLGLYPPAQFSALWPHRLHSIGAWIGVLLGALATGALAWRRGLSRRVGIVWTLLGALLGPLGVVLMLVEQDFPAREPCASCGRLRPVSEDTCRACAASWPTPPLDDTAIVA